MEWLLTFLTPYAAIAPLGTLTFAALAVCVALWSLLAQKRIARGRAAVDFFLKTEMGAAMLAAYDNYNKAIAALKNSTISVDYFSKDTATEKHYSAIRTYLDINELMAIAITTKVFSMQVSYNFWCNILDQIYTESEKVIEHARAQPHGEDRYIGIITLNALWKSPDRFYQRWRK